ncbi:hypothetical protein [Bartonella sp. CB178]|uniref:hypothetical protein n=1 Tax=Bartonella sp. CB178 TaxID=3112255 RepID=UPI00300E5531
MFVSYLLIFNNELQIVYLGRGILGRSKRDTAVWMHIIGSRGYAAAGYAGFKLEQGSIMNRWPGCVRRFMCLFSVKVGTLYFFCGWEVWYFGDALEESPCAF